MKTTTYKIEYGDYGYIRAASTMAAFGKRYPQAEIDYKKNRIQMTDNNAKIIFKFVKTDGDFSIKDFSRKYFR